MYLTDSNIHDRFNPEDYNDFNFWREPIIDLTLEEVEVEKVEEKKIEMPILSQYDNFMYWREPIPDLDEL